MAYTYSCPDGDGGFITISSDIPLSNPCPTTGSGGTGTSWDEGGEKGGDEDGEAGGKNGAGFLPFDLPPLITSAQWDAFVDWLKSLFGGLLDDIMDFLKKILLFIVIVAAILIVLKLKKK